MVCPTAVLVCSTTKSPPMLCPATVNFTPGPWLRRICVGYAASSSTRLSRIRSSPCGFCASRAVASADSVMPAKRAAL